MKETHKESCQRSKQGTQLPGNCVKMAGRETGMWVMRQTEVTLAERGGRGGAVFGAEV